MTPRETIMVIEAYLWRLKHSQRNEITMAWLTAALMRAKRMPSLAKLTAEKARPLHGAELQKRRMEFAEMTEHLDLEQLNANRTG